MHNESPIQLDSSYYGEPRTEKEDYISKEVKSAVKHLITKNVVFYQIVAGQYTSQVAPKSASEHSIERVQRFPAGVAAPAT